MSPAVRNVALRQSFFHIGEIESLKDAASFYVTEITSPEKWYPKNFHATVAKFNDLPARYRDNINMQSPFGGKPSFDDGETDDVVVVLRR